MSSIKIKNFQLNNDTVESLNKLIDKNINANVAFRLMRIMKEIASITDDKIKMERKIIDKWTLKDENGEIIRPKNELGVESQDSIQITNVDEFNKEMTDFLNMENEIGYALINFEDLKLDTASVKDLSKLDFLFE